MIARDWFLFFSLFSTQIYAILIIDNLAISVISKLAMDLSEGI